MRNKALCLTLVLACLTCAPLASAWQFNWIPASRLVSLQVGDGGVLVNQTTVNLVSVTVTAAQLGNGLPLPMAINSSAMVNPTGMAGAGCSQSTGQVYVGAGYRVPSSGGSANLQVSTSASLINASGDSIPFSSISWTSSGGAIKIPGGNFTGGAIMLASMKGNDYFENCHSFSYSNSVVRAAGTYTGRATYTLTAP